MQKIFIMEEFMLRKIKVVVLSVVMVLSFCLCIMNVNGLRASADGSADQPTVMSEKITTEEMIKAILAAGTGDDGGYSKSIDMSLFSYSIGYGKVDAGSNAVDYHGYEVNNGGFRTSAVYNASKYQSSVLLSGGTARIANYALIDGATVPGNYNIIYRIVAKQEINVLLTHDGRNNADVGMFANTYHKTADATTTLFSYEVPGGGAAVAANAYSGTYKINAGEEFIFEFACVSDANKVVTFYGALYPDFTVSRADALSIEKNNRIEALTATKNALVESDYVAEDYTALVAVYDKAIADINTASELSEVEAIVATASADAADILTIAGAESYRATVKANMETYLASVDSSLYKTETYANIVSIAGGIESAVASLTRKSAIDGAYNEIIAEIVKLPKDAPVTSLTTSFMEIVNGVIGAGAENGAYSGYGENQLVSYTVGYGRAFKTLSQLALNGFEVSEGGLATANLSKEGVNASLVSTANSKIQLSNFVLSGSSRTAANGNVIFKLVAKDNVKITISHAAGVATQKTFVKTYKTEANEIWELKAADLTADFEENAYGGVWTVAAGDALFLEFAIEGSDFVTDVIEAIPSFFVEIIDASELVTAIPTDDQLEILDSTLLNMISTSSEYGGGVVRTKGIDWQLLHGAPENAVAYEIVGGGVLRTEKKNPQGYNSIYAANAGNKFIRTDIANGEKFLVKIVARQNVKISISSEAWQKTNHSLAADYSCVLSHYSEEDGVWYYYTYDTVTISWPTELEAGALNKEIHLNAGDVMWYVIAGPNHTTNITFLPSITVDPSAYDASKVFDFMGYMQTQEAIVGEKAKLQTAYEELSFEEYSTDAYLELCTIYEEAIVQIDDCATMEELEALVVTVNAKVADFIKVSEKESAKQAILDALEAHIGTLNKNGYKTETWQSILNIKANLSTELDSVERKSEQQELLAEAKAEIDLIPEDQEPVNSCGGSINGSIGLVLLGAVAYAILRRKSKED